MTREEFIATLKNLDVKEYGGEFRIKGFLLGYVNSPICGYISMIGKIPYSLARTIFDQADKYSLDASYLLFVHEDPTNPIEKKYIDRIKIDSIEALRFVIETIREHPFINEWAIGNY